jgi:hypothetical protein
MHLSVELGGVRLDVRGLGGVITLAGLILIAVALADQLRRPASLRTWHGELWGLIPYDFRPPTLGRVVRSVWNPASERVFSGKTFGVGWDVNVAALGRRLGLTA